MLHTSSRTAGLAGIAALVGMMMAVAIVAVVRQPDPAPSLPATVRGDASQSALARELDRCAALTMPDSGCEAAWAETRRRFFRHPAPAAGEAASTGTVAP